MQALKHAEEAEHAKTSRAGSRTGSRTGSRAGRRARGRRGDSGIAGRPVGNEWLNIPARVQCTLAVQCNLAMAGERPGKPGGPSMALNIIARKQ